MSTDPRAQPILTQQRRRRWGRYFLYIGLVTFVGLVVLEVGLRLRDTLLGADYIPGRGYTDSPDVALFERHPYLQAIPKLGTFWSGVDPEGRPITISINSQGFRGKEFEHSKAAEEYRIIALGGSTTFGTSSTSDATTYPQLLENILNEQLQGSGKRVTVINAGVPGYTTVESLINLELRLLDLRPDLVTVYHAYNDMKPNTSKGFRSDYSHWRRPVTPHGTYLLEYSRVFVKLRSLYQRLVGSFPETEREDSPSEPGILAFKRNLRSTIYVARQSGVEVVLSTYASSLTPDNLEEHPERFRFVWSYLPQLTYKGMIEAFRMYNLAIEEVALEEGVALACGRERVPPDFDHLTDHVHLTDAGGQRMAEAFAAAILPLIQQEPQGSEVPLSLAQAPSCASLAQDGG